MNLRIEFEAHQSPKFPWLLRLCKKFPTYKVSQDDGLIVHSIEFTEKEIDQFRAIHAILYGLPRVAYYIDERLVPQGVIFKLAAELEAEDRLNKWADRKTRDERMRALFHPSPNDAFLAKLKKYGILGNPN